MNATPFNYLEDLKNQVDLLEIPFSTRGSRLAVIRRGRGLEIKALDKPHRSALEPSFVNRRAPILEDLQFIDGDGQALAFTVETYPHKLEFQTAAGIFTLAFADMESIYISFPTGSCGISALVDVPNAETDRRGGIFLNRGEDRYRMAYTANRAILRNEILPIKDSQSRLILLVASGETGGLVLNITPRLGMSRYVPDGAAVFERAANEWTAWFEQFPRVAAPYRPLYYFSLWVLRAGLLSTRYFTTREVMTSFKPYSSAVWQWDAFFHALAYRHGDLKLAKDQIRLFLDHQLQNGMLPDAIHDDGIITRFDTARDSEVSKPPLLAWITLKVFEADQDVEFLQEVYSHLETWSDWWFKYNDRSDDGLYFVPKSQPFDLDDPAEKDDEKVVKSPDLNTYIYLQMESLSRIAQSLGDLEGANLWKERAKKLFDQILNLLQEGQLGVFWAHQQGRPICVPTPASLFPLIAGSLETEETRHLIETLTLPEAFWTEFPLPVVKLNDPPISENPQWKGPSWVSIFYLLLEGLDWSGYQQVGDDLSARMLEKIEQEFTNGELPAAGKDHYKPVFGWAAALYIEFAIRANSTRKMTSARPLIGRVLGYAAPVQVPEDFFPRFYGLNGDRRSRFSLVFARKGGRILPA